MTHWQMALGGGVIMLTLFLWAAQRSAHPFDIRDVLMDPATGKAGLNALGVAVMLFLSCWVIVDRELAGKEDVGSILNIALLTFVGGRVASGAIAAFKPTTDVGTTTRTTTDTVIVAPTVPDPVPIPEAAGGDVSVKKTTRRSAK